jgi:long-chain fatty acid transport protein
MKFPRTKKNLLIGVLTLALFFPIRSLAGPYHYSDILIGDRAMGMGGAFGGVADDSSALFYNPAGLAFAASSTLSSAVNAFQMTNREYRNLFAGKDSFFETSSDIIPSFTGGVIDLKKVSEGLHGAFALQNLSQQSSNQNDFIRRPDISVEYLHRAEKSQMSELLFSAGAGKRFGPNFALGISLSGHRLTVDKQQFQDSTIKRNLRYSKITNPNITNKTLFQSRTINTRFSAAANSAEAGGGIIYTPIPWVSIGFSIHSQLQIGQSFEFESDELGTYHYEDLSRPVTSDFEAMPDAAADNAQAEIDLLTNKTLYRKSSNTEPSSVKYKFAPSKGKNSSGVSIGRSRTRLGVAAFPSPSLLLTLDLVGHDTREEWILSPNLSTEFVVNVHQGLEYFLTPRFFVRQGLFTNFDSRPAEISSSNNPEHLNFAGSSLFFGLQSSESQFSLGAIYQYGWGEALKAEGQAKPSPLRESKLLMAFTASHGL